MEDYNDVARSEKQKNSKCFNTLPRKNNSVLNMGETGNLVKFDKSFK